jgi:hypothetical protein
MSDGREKSWVLSSLLVTNSGLRAGSRDGSSREPMESIRKL